MAQAGAASRINVPNHLLHGRRRRRRRQREGFTFFIDSTSMAHDGTTPPSCVIFVDRNKVSHLLDVIALYVVHGMFGELKKSGQTGSLTSRKLDNCRKTILGSYFNP